MVSPNKFGRSIGFHWLANIHLNVIKLNSDHLHFSGVYSAAGFQVKLQRKQMQFVVQVNNFQYFIFREVLKKSAKNVTPTSDTPPTLVWLTEPSI